MRLTICDARLAGANYQALNLWGSRQTGGRSNLIIAGSRPIRPGDIFTGSRRKHLIFKDPKRG